MSYKDKYKQELLKYVKNTGVLKKLSGKSIAVTGAAGLIGTYLVDLIMCYNEINCDKIYIICIDKNQENIEKRFSKYDQSLLCCIGDINDCQFVNSLSAYHIDYIIHAASNTSPVDYAQDPVGTITTNVIGTYNLLELCKNNNINHFMFCSSVEMYGANNGDIDDFDEEYSGYLNCNTVRASYPSGKRAGESMCCSYNSQYGVNYTIARIGRIYGPTIIEGDTKAPTQFIMNAVRGEDVILKSDGLQHYSYCYVGDCVTAMLTILVNGKFGEAYNIADPNSKVYLKDFANIAATVANAKCSYQLPNQIEIAGYSKISKATMDVNKLLEIGWRPITDLVDGIKQTIDYLKKEMN